MAAAYVPDVVEKMDGVRCRKNNEWRVVRVFTTRHSLLAG